MTDTAQEHAVDLLHVGVVVVFVAATPQTSIAHFVVSAHSTIIKEHRISAVWQSNLDGSAYLVKELGKLAYQYVVVAALFSIISLQWKQDRSIVSYNLQCSTGVYPLPIK